MDGQNKHPVTAYPVELPVKRKRGRPRKDESLVLQQQERTQLQPPQLPLPGEVRSNPQAEVDPGDGPSDEMLGQVVSGVIEGSFDAGYFLSVRAGTCSTLLRGVVFQPGLFTPITAANDVAPDARMYKRREFPNPVLDPQGQANSSIPQSEKKNEQQQQQPAQLENKEPAPPAQVLTFVGQPGSSTSLASQSASDLPKQEAAAMPQNNPSQYASVKVPLADTFLKNDIVDSMGGNDKPQEISEFGLVNKSSTHQLQSVVPFPLANLSSPGKLSVIDSLSKNSLCASMGEKSLQQQNSEIGLDNPFSKQLHSSTTPFTLTPHSASVVIPFNSNLPKNNSGAFLGGKDLPQQNFDYGLEKHSITRLQSCLPFSLASGDASATLLPLTDNLAKNDSSALMEGKDMSIQQRRFEASLAENQPASHLQRGSPFTLASQSNTSMVAQTDNLTKDELGGAPLLEKNMQQQITEIGRENLSNPQLDGSRMTEQDEIMQEFEASNLLERQKIDVQGTKDMILDIGSELTLDIFHGKPSSCQVLQVQDQAVDSGLLSTELAHSGPNGMNLELHQALLSVKPGPVLPEKPISAKNETQGAESVPPYSLGRDEIFENEKPMSDAADDIIGASQPAPDAKEQIRTIEEATFEEATPLEPEVNCIGGSIGKDQSSKLY
ncbi:uncharacterized protein LOC127807343 [Diospyros lotus]|uniref:uncharacterized protein LOC127807343 n=1 Tax=Diospyros lotus TaxID=55363 RepID=UPI002254E8FF|nr:uncharacterized protein LOC127807343 [Diospyros lotus]